MNKVKKTKKKYYIEKEVTSYDWNCVGSYWFILFIQHIFLLSGIYNLSNAKLIDEWVGGSILIVFWGCCTWALSHDYMTGTNDVVKKNKIKEEVKIIEE